MNESSFFKPCFHTQGVSESVKMSGVMLLMSCFGPEINSKIYHSSGRGRVQTARKQLLGNSKH